MYALKKRMRIYIYIYYAHLHVVVVGDWQLVANSCTCIRIESQDSGFIENVFLHILNLEPSSCNCLGIEDSRFKVLEKAFPGI